MAFLQAPPSLGNQFDDDRVLRSYLARVLPDGVTARLDRTTWTPAPVFGLVQRTGGISQADLEATLNMGVGMAVVLPPEAVAGARATLGAAGIESWVCGEVVASGPDEPRVTLSGAHESF